MDSQLKSIENSKIVLEFSGGFFKKEKATFAHRNVVNVFIVNELDTWVRDLIQNLHKVIACLESRK